VRLRRKDNTEAAESEANLAAMEDELDGILQVELAKYAKGTIQA
jgi:hypothetical protein